MKTHFIPAAVALASFLLPRIACGEFPKLALEPVSQAALGAPVGITNAADGTGRIFITEQRGTVRVLKGGELLPTPFLDISQKLVPEREGFDERGLLSTAFHPDYSQPDAPGSGKFFVYYSAPSPGAPGTEGAPVDHRSVVAEFTVSTDDPDIADPGSERVLLTIDQPQFNHDGGQLAFGPEDKLLYISTGDGGSSDDNDAGHTGGNPEQPAGVLGNAQDLEKLLGKILRVDPFGTGGPGGGYGIPADNPFASGAGPARPEIYAYGLRNPWRFSFDDGPGGTNRLFCADVGQGSFEEINIIEPGKNYGWRNREGSSVFDATAPAAGPFEDPVAEYGHPFTETDLPKIGLSVTGGHVYRGQEIPGLAGRYVFADWSNAFVPGNGTLLGLEEDGQGAFSLEILDVSGGNPVFHYLAAIGEDEAGELYIAAKTTLAPSGLDPVSGLPTGVIFKLVPAAEESISTTATLAAAKDNSIYSEGELSNGAGQYLFSGRIAARGGNALRRALVQFDVAGALPAGATVDTSSLTLRMNKTVTGNSTMSLHRLGGDWGEAGSNASGQEGKGTSAENGDATWMNAFSADVAWDTEGGDFDPSPSASAEVGGSGFYSWTSPGLVGDVQSFLDEPTLNFGWVLIGDESRQSAKRFVSSESNTADQRPVLEIGYSTAGAPGNRERWIAEFFEEGETVDNLEDLDGDGLNAIFEYAAGFDPKTKNAPGAAFSVVVDQESAESGILVTFRRDPLATDLTYRIEASENLTEWTALTEITGGGAPAGTGFDSEAPVVGEFPIRSVRVNDTRLVTDEIPRFVRMVVTLQP